MFRSIIHALVGREEYKTVTQMQRAHMVRRSHSWTASQQASQPA